MKKFLAIFAAMTLVLSMSACNSDDNLPSQGGAAVDEKGNEIIGTSIDGAIDEVDMDKVEGTELKLDKDASGDTKATIAGLDVSVGEAKLMDNDGDKLLVVTFEFENKTSGPVSFDTVVDVDVTQNGSEIRTTLTNNIEGINVRSGIETVASGKSAVVQKTYPITDTESPVTVTAYKCNEPSSKGVGAVFNLK